MLRLYAMEPRLRLKRSPPEAGIFSTYLTFLAELPLEYIYIDIYIYRYIDIYIYGPLSVKTGLNDIT